MRFHDDRERLLAEIHARPSTPIAAPILATRIGAVSGQHGDDDDRAHMADLCRRFDRPAPSPGARWCELAADGWELRWERHSEFSSWTFFRTPGPDPEHDSALTQVPTDWVDAIPGAVIVLTTLLVTRDRRAPVADASPHDAIGSVLMDGAARVFTDLRADAGGMTRYRLELDGDDPVLAGRLALILLEIETYRLMALLAFPLAGEAAALMRGLEGEAGTLAARLADNLGVEDDRALLAGLVALSGRAEALSARTSFRFGAGNAYYDIVLGRIASLRETPLPGMQTIGEFMDRRLGPAMRTCASVAAREAQVIARIARAGQMLNTRVELVAEAISADLLQSMDRRALAQLRLQRTVEGLSVAAISYYAISLFIFPAQALRRVWPWFDPIIAAGILAPIAVLLVWSALARIRRGIGPELSDRKP